MNNIMMVSYHLIFNFDISMILRCTTQDRFLTLKGFIELDSIMGTKPNSDKGMSKVKRQSEVSVLLYCFMFSQA